MYKIYNTSEASGAMNIAHKNAINVNVQSPVRPLRIGNIEKTNSIEIAYVIIN